jgi:hypothetical protein
MAEIDSTLLLKVFNLLELLNKKHKTMYTLHIHSDFSGDLLDFDDNNVGEFNNVEQCYKLLQELLNE